MSTIKVLDVTLRDGGYRNDFGFTEHYAETLVGRLVDAGVQYCEIGYCNGSFARKEEHGMTSLVMPDYISNLKRIAGDRLGLAVMVHPKNVMTSDFEMLRDNGVSLIRVCLRRDQLAEGLATLEAPKNLGFVVSANVTHITSQSMSAVIDTSVRAEAAGADIICFADSNGNMIPLDVEKLISRVFNRVMVPLGFHAHNNLSLALANAAAAIDNGAEFIDASVCGMGKGAGNLHLGMIVAYLERVGLKHNYDLVRVLELSKYTSATVPKSDLPSPLMDVILGAYNFPFDVSKRMNETIERFQLNSEFQAIQIMHEQDQVARFAPRAVFNQPSSAGALAIAEGDR